jgi:hypothetical protein
MYLEKFEDALNDFNEASKEVRGQDLPYFKSKAYHLSGNPQGAWAEIIKCQNKSQDPRIPFLKALISEEQINRQDLDANRRKEQIDSTISLFEQVLTDLPYLSKDPFRLVDISQWELKQSSLSKLGIWFREVGRFQESLELVDSPFERGLTYKSMGQYRLAVQ